MADGRCQSLAQLQQQLEAQHNVTLTTKPVTLDSGAETLALLFAFEGLTYSASKLGKKYRYKRLSAEFEAAAQLAQAPDQQQEPLTVATGRGGDGAEGAALNGQEEAGISDTAIDVAAPVKPIGAAAVDEPTETKAKVVEAETVETDLPVVSAARLSTLSAAAREAEAHEDWQSWLDNQQHVEQHPPAARQDVSEQVQQDWALWRAFSKGTEQWLQQKGIAPAPDSEGQRRLAQVALYCRLKGYAPEKVARALMISPCKTSYRDPRLESLNWKERDKEQFAILKLMVQVDEQVRQRQKAMEELLPSTQRGR
jgi:hypothetical protein